MKRMIILPLIGILALGGTLYRTGYDRGKNETFQKIETARNKLVDEKMSKLADELYPMPYSVGDLEASYLIDARKVFVTGDSTNALYPEGWENVAKRGQLERERILSQISYSEARRFIDEKSDNHNL